MTVVLVGPGFPPDSGGVETHLREVARGVSGRGVEVEVWVPTRQDRVTLTERIDGVLVRRFASTRSHRFPLAPALWRQARSLTAGDVLHVQSYHNAAALAALTAPAAVPVIFTPHYHGGGHSRLASLLHVPYRAFGSRVMARARTILAVTAAERDLIERDFPTASGRVRVSRNGADVTAIHGADPFDAEPPTVLVAGRLENYKRVDAVISAFGAATNVGQLVVTGDGPDRGRLEAIAASSPRRADIHILGRVPDGDLTRWLRTASGVVSMSEHEAFGIVGLEAVAAGGRAVLSDIPAHREVSTMCPEDTVRIATSAELTPVLDDLLASPRPGAGRVVRSWSDVVDDHVDLYRELSSARS